jgi:putative SOS response-associated peptidase YedK
MCGRYGRSSRKERFEQLLGLERKTGGDMFGNYNIAPSRSLGSSAPAQRPIPCSSRTSGASPVLDKGPPKATQRPVNTRAETVAEKADVPPSHRQQRCLGALFRF